MQGLIRPKAAFVVSALLIASQPSMASQEIDAKWGDIPLDDLEMTAYPADSNATAVILYDFASAKFDRRLDLRTERHTRIKILTEAGYDWGTVHIPYYSGRNGERISRIEGLTHNLMPDGSVQTSSLDRKSIFDEKVHGDTKRIRFTLPALAPGSVIEYRYTVSTTSPFLLRDWNFQTSEPTRWSEYRVEVPPELAYVIVRQGTHRLEISDSQKITGPGSVGAVSTMRYRWAARDVPALRDEPYITTLDDYRLRMNIQLSTIRYRGRTPVNVLNTWSKAAEELMSHSSFGRQLSIPRQIRREVDGLTEGVTSETDRMRAIYDYVRTSMEWDGSRGILTQDGVSRAYSAKRGNGPEIALLVVGLMREAGLTSHPVLISTRANGQLQDLYPIVTQFNHVLVFVEADGEQWLLDATNPLRPYDILPLAALNGRGWLVDPPNSRWVSIENEKRYRSHTSLSASIDEHGGISGSSRTADYDYRALRRRQLFSETTPEEFVRDQLLSSVAEVEVDSLDISGLDDIEGAFQTVVQFTASTYAQVAGDFLYLNPTIMERMEENPFKQETRSFPVDYGAGIDVTYVASLSIPEGYEVHDHPRNMGLRMPGNVVEFRRLVEATENRITLNYRFQVEKTLFGPREYEALRDFYDRMVAAHDEQIVLRRIDSDQASVETE